MKAPSKIAMPQLAGMRRSVEVQHGRRGLGLMFRRGLHGAKNWVLEPDANGLPRSPWGKAGRVLVVLAPIWIVLSAATGGPQRGGHPTSILQAVFFAVVATLVGLGFFSARERRLGREEPWNDLPRVVTDGDNLESEEPTGGPPEKPTQVTKEPQVRAACNFEKAATGEDISDTLSHFSQSDLDALREPLQQAIPAESSTLGATAIGGPATGVQDQVQQAITEGVNQEVLDRTFDTDSLPGSEAPTEALRTIDSDHSFPQVRPSVEALHEGLEKVDSVGQYQGVPGVPVVAESNEGMLQEAPTVPLRPTLQTLLQAGDREPPYPQASTLSKPLPQPLQGALQVQYAVPGPYEVKEGPVANDWWATKPDVPAEPVVETPDPEKLQPERQAPEPVTEEAAVPAVQPQQGGVPDVVTRWIASQFGPAFSEAEKETARVEVVHWLHEEVASERITQTEAARMLRVHKSTVSRWLNSDPWAD